MESDLEQQQQAPPQVNLSGGLTRYRSAPSSYFNNIIDREFYEHVFNRPSSPETERVFSRFMNSLGSETVEEDSSSVAQKVKEEEVINNNEHEHVVLQQQHQQQSNINNISNENYNSVPTTHQQQQHPLATFYQKPPLPNVGNQNHSSNLIRHSSSPAGLFSQINIENGYVVGMRGMGEAKFSNARSLKSQSNYSSGLMSSISEIGEKSNRGNNLDSEAFAESHGNDFITDYQVGPWNDLSENVSGLKRFVDHDSKPFSGLNAAATQNESGGQSHSPLVHQLSMPNTSAEMAAIEKFLHFTDAVPCKIRAKRGCATHPRSIAERVRRTKISERMRKLQDLVPNMDKQTNTSDMLDLAVDYIKDLQKEVQTLSDCQAKCTCSHKQQL